jgi:hypothetical protein
MPEDREALLQHYRLMRADLLAAIDGLTDALLSEPTLDGWSIKDHLAMSPSGTRSELLS